MSTPRLTTLLKFLQDDPNDPFTLYAVATEYRKVNISKTLLYYKKLLADHPQYVATYYHAALLYVDLGKPDRAKETFEKGITVAQEQHEALALRELQNAYNEFLFEE